MRDKTQHPTKSKQRRGIEGAFQPRIPKQRKEYQEIGPGKIDIVMCSECRSVYHGKNWHHNLGDYRRLSENKRIKFVICPACQMIKDKKHEGQMVLEGVSLDKKEEILKLIKNVGQRAFKRDPMDRIIKINDDKRNIEVLTTENQLAVSIGKQIERAFGGNLDIQWSHEESVVRAKVVFS